MVPLVLKGEYDVYTQRITGSKFLMIMTKLGAKYEPLRNDKDVLTKAVVSYYKDGGFDIVEVGEFSYDEFKLNPTLKMKFVKALLGKDSSVEAEFLELVKANLEGRNEKLFGKFYDKLTKEGRLVVSTGHAKVKVMKDITVRDVAKKLGRFGFITFVPMALVSYDLIENWRIHLLKHYIGTEMWNLTRYYKSAFEEFEWEPFEEFEWEPYEFSLRTHSGQPIRLVGRTSKLMDGKLINIEQVEMLGVVFDEVNMEPIRTNYWYFKSDSELENALMLMLLSRMWSSTENVSVESTVISLDENDWNINLFA
ncbi:MAG TPA: hypothetical protein PKV93_09860 [Fervidobacterium sp.]|nr:hypothetical protein [Fervidobacterium sp.]